LRGLSMSVTTTESGWNVTAPSARFDIEIESDLIEEVVRLYGYDRIPEAPGDLKTALGRPSEAVIPLARIRTTLVARDYQEAITYSFIGEEQGLEFGAQPDSLALANPISADLGVMRQSLLPGLVQALQYNLNRQQARVRLFETGSRFISQDTVIKQEQVLSGVIAGGVNAEQWGAAARPVDFFDMKSDLEALFSLTGMKADFEFQADTHPAMRPGRTARIDRDGTAIGWCGELHPSLCRKLQLNEIPMVFELEIEPTFAACVTEYSGISRFPAVRRDIAVLVSDEVPVAKLEQHAREAGGPILRDVVVFDIFSGKNIETGSRSVALGLILQETSRTLKETDVDKIVRSVTERLARDFNATIRE